MIAGLLATVLVSWLVGALVVSIGWPGRGPPGAARVMRGALALGFGLGLCSAALVVAIDLGRPSRTVAVLTDMTLVAIGVGMRAWTRRATRLVPDAPRPEWTPVDRMLGVGILLCALLAVSIGALRTIAYPHGDWDAWAIWNMKARFMSRGGDAWRAGLVHPVPHPDYPLLVPGAVARAWIYLKRETLLAPAGIAGAFTAATVVLAGSAVSLRRGRRLGLLTAVLLLGTPDLITYGTSQCADVPLGFFLLAALALLTTSDQPGGLPRPGATLLAGLALGLGAWTKNEGALYLVCVVLAHGLVTCIRRGIRATTAEVAALVAGSSPLLALLGYHRSTVPSNWLFGRQSVDAFLIRALDSARYRAIGAHLLRYGLGLGGGLVSVLALLALGALAWGLRIEPENRAGAGRTALALVGALVGIVGVYLVTPLPLLWQIGTSMPRLLLQLWPSALLLFALIVESPPARGPSHPSPLAPPG